MTGISPQRHTFEGRRAQPNGECSAAVDQTTLRAGHQRSECLRAYRSSTACCNAC